MSDSLADAISRAIKKKQDEGAQTPQSDAQKQAAADKAKKVLGY